METQAPAREAWSFPHLSFGVEIEFLVPVKQMGGSDPMGGDGVPPLLAFNNQLHGDQNSHVRSEVWNVLENIPVSLKKDSLRSESGDSSDDDVKKESAADVDQETDRFNSPTHWLMNDGWAVESDPSVQEDDTPDYRWAPIEIQSPAFRGCQAAMDEIRAVVTALKAKIRMRENSSCGLHVHVGCGSRRVRINEGGFIYDKHLPERIGFSVFKRIAKLCWAMDGVLSHAHPPERGQNNWTRSLRLSSELAQRKIPDRMRGRVPDSATPAVASRGEQGERGEQDRRVETLRRTRRLPATRVDVAHDPAAMIRLRQLWPYPEIDRPRVNMTKGLEWIDSCKNHWELADLLGKPANRLNYNFKSYTYPNRMQDLAQAFGHEVTFPDEGPSTIYASHYAAVRAEPIERFSDRQLYTLNGAQKATIEFREAPGSLDSDWIVTWARVCVSTLGFAMAVPDARFDAIIQKLVRAEETSKLDIHAYDMIDFVQDIGLFDGASKLEERFVRRDPHKTWFPCGLA